MSKARLAIQMLSLFLIAACKSRSWNPKPQDSEFMAIGDVPSNVCSDAATPTNRRYCEYMFANHFKIFAAAKIEYAKYGSTGGPCALTQSFGLQMSKVVNWGTTPPPPSTNGLQKALVENHGWVKNIKCTELRAGDIVLTMPKKPGDDIFYHSFIFVKYISYEDAQQYVDGGEYTRKFAAAYPSGGKTFAAWGLDYHNPEKTDAGLNAYKRWIIRPTAVLDAANNNPNEFLEQHLCDHGLRAGK